MSDQRTEPSLPRSRGVLSAGVVAHLRDEGALPGPGAARDADPYGDDLQLALYVCYELHYRGFAGVRPELEWDPALLALRGALEERFLTALRRDATGTAGLDEVLAGLLVEPVHGTGLSWFLQDNGELWHLREYAVQRSLYHLKEADPHAWVLPRLWGRAKAGMAAIEYDEFGAGRAERVHAQLFADLMADLELDTAYGRYLDEGYAEMLALVNLMSLFGLHRRLRGALVGHFAAVEITSSPASRRLARAMARAGAGRAAEFFYTEHVEADAVHEQVVRREVIGGLLDEEPGLAADIAFGITATSCLEDRLEDRLLTQWRV
ncbi:iron-containing redox enzyme family protein [Streptomyces sp. NPDC020403]|uniref:iron-containing redox enzyme family protein n=1 Tax=unclassified Streptomyces TaxID=2593676 RepID=UPI0034032266